MPQDYSIPAHENLIFLGREILQARIVPTEGAKSLNCYFNARDAVTKHGGSIIDSWEVVEVSGLFLHFRPHVLWRKSEREVIDPTPSEFGLSVTTYFESPTPHGLPMPAGYLHPLTNNPEFITKLRIQNIAYRLIAKKLTPGKEVTINNQALMAECTSILEAEKMMSHENLQLLVMLFLKGK
jgi:hypothetical protein